MPGGASIGPRATEYFCGAVAAGSGVLTWIVRDPFPALVVLTALSLLLAFLATRTSWRGASPLRLARRRAWGEMIVAAAHMYGRRPSLFLTISLLFIPFSIATAVVQYLLFRVVGLVPLVETAGESNVSVAGLAFSLGLLFTIVALAFVQAATAHAMAAIDRGEQVSARGAFRGSLRHLPALLGGVLRAAIVITLLDLTAIGIPVALWLLVRWSLLAQAVVLEPGGDRRPLRGSAALVRGHWWRVAIFTVVVAGLGLVSGPLIGGLLLLATNASFNIVNVVAGLVYVVTMPFVAIATTYLYYDVHTRSALAAVEAPVGRELPAEV